MHEREGDRSPRAARYGPVVAPSKGLRDVFAPLVDYGDDSDEDEPNSPGKVQVSVLLISCLGFRVRVHLDS